MDNFIGIDPGVSGAYAIVRADLHIEKIADFTSMLDIYESIREYRPKGAIMEAVHIWTGSASKASTTFMKNAGGIEAILEVLMIRHQLIQPQFWQKQCGVIITKPPVVGKLTEAQRRKRNAEHKARLKEKSIQQAARFFGLNQKTLNDAKADALNMARIAINMFGRGAHNGY